MRVAQNPIWRLPSMGLCAVCYNRHDFTLRFEKESRGHGFGCQRNDEYGGTALHTAAMRGDAEKAWALIAAGADLNAKSNAGMTALHWAAVRGHTKTVRALVELGADMRA